ncbi:DUF3347 domain-containing protein [Flavisolibacter nicotianae]|uniref:DUF3347 domain-containing protein n=1 Tax=Flavisolibacter nicotianae TaxID=2364882 RepID=UPI000EB1670E|nr:DUF3347 domain-containing protein [Flavisolibacter nicotianae]
MKKKNILLSLIAVFILAPFFGFSQAQDGALSSLLTKYFAVKNALVAGDAAGAGKAAADFVSAAKVLDQKSLTATEQKAYNAVQAKLLADAGALAGTKDLARQRTTFQSFSDNMIALSKATKPAAPVYVAYCPMKKASWLSNEKVIKNPYYGSTMLSCGQVTDTIK